VRTRIERCYTLSSHGFKRGKTHIDGVETVAPANGQDESCDADYGGDQDEQHGKRYQFVQNRSPPGDNNYATIHSNRKLLDAKGCGVRLTAVSGR
jgi:hypothetical protein